MSIGLRTFALKSVILNVVTVLAVSGPLAFPCRAEASPRKIPPPPILILPLDKIEPPRDAAADRWQSVYCLDWNDGCTRCARESVRVKQHCSPVQSESKQCERSFVACTKRSDDMFARVCRESFSYLLSQDEFRVNKTEFAEYIKFYNFGGDQWKWQFEHNVWHPNSFGSAVLVTRPEHYPEQDTLKKEFDNKRILQQICVLPQSQDTLRADWDSARNQ